MHDPFTRCAERQTRVRLSRMVRRHAAVEVERRFRGGVVDFRAIRRRSALHETIAQLLEDGSGPIPAAALAQLEALLEERRLGHDYGVEASDRDARLAALIGALAPGEPCSDRRAEDPHRGSVRLPMTLDTDRHEPARQISA
jgi:hypothetical protein